MSEVHSDQSLPYSGVRVVEMTHMVMGPTCGMVLADLGAEVIKVEPITGDSTRNLRGSGAGFFSTFNRNKKSIAVDLKDPRGVEIVHKLLANADVFSENFKSGTVDKLGLGYSALSRLNPRLIYVSHKGFLPGPYDHRTALDEVVQMMGGLLPFRSEFEHGCAVTSEALRRPEVWRRVLALTDELERAGSMYAEAIGEFLPAPELDWPPSAATRWRGRNRVKP